VLALLASTTGTAAGDFDPAYAIDGVAALPRDAAVLATSGNGLLYFVARSDGFDVHRIRADGRPEAQYGSSGRVAIDGARLYGNVVAQTADGGLLFGVQVDATVSGATRRVNAVLRLRADGRRDASFGLAGNGVVALDGEHQASAAPINTVAAWPTAIAAYPDGRVAFAIAVRLSTATVNFEPDCRARVSVMRLLADGRLDRNFGTEGSVEIETSKVACGGAVLFARRDGTLLVAEQGRGLQVTRLAATGSIDGVFRTSGVPPDIPGWAKARPLRSGGILLVGPSVVDYYSDPVPDRVVLARIDADLRLDPAFGAGGVLSVDPGALLTGREGHDAFTWDAATSPDDRYAYIGVDAGSRDPADVHRPGCAGILRVALAPGVMDTGFGAHGGLACVLPAWQVEYDEGTFLEAPLRFADVLQWDDGRVGLRAPDAVVRLLGDGAAGPGILSIEPRVAASESTRRLSFVVTRTGGASGAVSVGFSTEDGRAGLGPLNVASNGPDYVATSGSLHWPDGDRTERTIDVALIDDGALERSERFSVKLAGTTGGARVLGDTGEGVILDDSPSPVPFRWLSSPDGNAGGSGAISATTLGGLLAWLLACKRLRRAAILPAVAALGACGGSDPAVGPAFAVATPPPSSSAAPSSLGVTTLRPCEPAPAPPSAGAAVALGEHVVHIRSQADFDLGHARVVTDDRTKFDFSHGAFPDYVFPGVWFDITGTAAADGSITAATVQRGREPVAWIQGPIDAFADGDRVSGNWAFKVLGFSVIATPCTRVLESSPAGAAPRPIAGEDLRIGDTVIVPASGWFRPPGAPAIWVRRVPDTREVDVRGFFVNNHDRFARTFELGDSGTRVRVADSTRFYRGHQFFGSGPDGCSCDEASEQEFWDAIHGIGYVLFGNTQIRGRLDGAIVVATDIYWFYD
jgi:hypothetical protein